MFKHFVKYFLIESGCAIVFSGHTIVDEDYGGKPVIIMARNDADSDDDDDVYVTIILFYVQ